MTTNMLPVPSTLDLLIGGFRAHAHGRSLPVPVLVAFRSGEGLVEVQPEGGLDLARSLGNVLLWAATLAEVTARWTHRPEGRLHVSIRGRGASGVRFLVYGGGEFAECLGLVQLASGQREGVSLDELYALACATDSTSGRWPDERPSDAGRADAATARL
jgi:hypothetical protein